MRSLSPIVVAAALFAAPPAFAAVITQTLPAVQTIGDLRPFDIVGSRFDPSLGTLVSVGGQLTGTATPILYRSLGPFPDTRLTTTWSVSVASPGTGRFEGALPDRVVAPAAPGNGRYTGSPLPVSLAFDFDDPAVFVGDSSSPRTLLLFGFRADAPDLTTPSGGESDLTRFDGSLTLTYTYEPLAYGALGLSGTNVPEPAGVLVFGVGLLALMGCGITVGRSSRAL